MSKPAFTRCQIDKKWRGKAKCACCAEIAIHHLTWKNGWFRGDDDDELVCDRHLAMAKDHPRDFWQLVQERDKYLDTIVDAQHEETGREWRGTRRTLPPRYAETTATNSRAPT